MSKKPKREMFESSVRPSRDLAGVFECDGETGYFYLYDEKGKEGRKVISAIRVVTTNPDFNEHDVAIRWDPTETRVGLFIRNRLWAVFDAETHAKYGGDYHPNGRAEIPPEIYGPFTQS